MKQIFALTSAMLAVEFTDQYSEHNLLETLSLVGQKTGVKFDKVEETYKLTGQWLNVLEAYDVLLNILLTEDVANMQEDFGWNMSMETIEPSGSRQLSNSKEQNTAGLDYVHSKSLGPKKHEAHQFDTNATIHLPESAVVEKRELDQEHDLTMDDLEKDLLQPVNQTNLSSDNYTAVKNDLERVSRRKSMPYKLFLESDNDDTSNDIQDESLTVKRKCKSFPIKLTVKKKRGRKKKIRDADEVFKCVKCDYVGKTLHQLNRHKKRIHNDGKRFQCGQCSKSYGVATDLNRHRKTVHETPLFICEICNKSYKSSRGFDDHVKSHKDNYVKPLFPCTMCEKTYSSKMGLAHHVKGDHLGIKHPFLCSICGQGFTNKTSYQGHSNVHAGIKPHLCKICNKSFANQNGLWLHRRTHDETCRYSCETCGKTFRQSNSLKVHKKIHEEIRNHFCSICGKAFTQKQALHRHERVHSGVKPFECLLCNKRFYDTSIIRRHMIFMHKKEPERWRDDMFTHVNLLKKNPALIDTDVSQARNDMEIEASFAISN